VQLTQPRGAAVAPEPSKEPSVEPSAARAHLREAPPKGVAVPSRFNLRKCAVAHIFDSRYSDRCPVCHPGGGLPPGLAARLGGLLGPR
jgi:hypothetical protein